jgi:protoporphyrinogen oxidase
MQEGSVDNGIVVLGAGLAGLSAALHCSAPVYEAEARHGGVAASDRADGFTFDRGIHVLQTRNQRVLQLFAELGIEFQVHKRNAYIYSHGRYTPYPFQVNTAGLPLRLRTRCVWDFLRRGSEPRPRNYEEWIRGNVGRGFGETFLVPYSEKFWTVHPREMTFNWTANRVPQPSVGQVLRGALWNRNTAIGTNTVFRYPASKGGYGSIADAFCRRIPAPILGHRATHLDPKRRVVVFNDRTEVPYEVLLSTIPLPELIRISAGTDEEVRVAAQQLRTNSIYVVNLGIARANLSDKHWVHFPENDIAFFRISYPHNFSGNVAPEGTSSISAEVAYSATRPIDKSTIVDRVISDLIRVGALGKEDAIVSRSVHDLPYAYCIYDMQRAPALRTLYRWLRANAIVTAGRYGLWTYFWSDEAILSGKKAAEKALALCNTRVSHGIERGTAA